MSRNTPSTALSIPKLMATAAAVALTASYAAITPASAGIKSISIEKQTSPFDAGPAIVMKDSGSGYVLDKTESAKIRMRIRARVDKKNGINNAITVAEVGLQNRKIYALPLNYRPVELDETVEATVGANDLDPYVNHAASRCNLGGEPGKVVKLPFYFGTHFQVWDLGPSDTRSASETFEGTIACGPRKAPKGPGDVAAAEPDFRVKDIAIRLLTTAGKPASPNPGTKCQESTARVRIATTKAGPVKFKLWTKIGSHMQSKVVDTWSSFAGPGKFEAVFNEKVNVEKSSEIQVMAEDLTNPIGQSTGWKAAHLDCSGAGGGGLTSTPGTGNPDEPAKQPSLAVTGHLGLGEKPSAGRDKPRDATVVVRLWSNKPGSIPYKLTCTGGHEWTGTLPTTRIGPAKYQAHVFKTVHIDRTTQLACAVRSTALPGDPVVALASKQYVVVQRNVDLSGPGTIATAPRGTSNPASKKEVKNTKTAPSKNVPASRPGVRPDRQPPENTARRVDAERPSAGRAGLTKAASADERPAQATGGADRFDRRKPH
ncbi:MAG TPA: hypothetical protein VFV47_09355 [Hyphomicrobiaceae bacterium]|nr:hypothetical protein [Hyphomicrobiaceae bacterium]